ncbi:hypothetical protein U1Q18_002434 [Sarracenia purpurea var. burkii]
MNGISFATAFEEVAKERPAFLRNIYVGKKSVAKGSRKVFSVLRSGAVIWAKSQATKSSAKIQIWEIWVVIRWKSHWISHSDSIAEEYFWFRDSTKSLKEERKIKGNNLVRCTVEAIFPVKKTKAVRLNCLNGEDWKLKFGNFW